MKKRILTCMLVISVMLFTGCGISYSDLTKEIGCGAPYPVDDSEKDKNGNDEEAWILRKSVTDNEKYKPSLEINLFADELSLPIDINELMEYQVSSAAIKQDYLYAVADNYTKSFSSKEFIVCDKTGEKYSYMPNIVLGEDGCSRKTTVKQAILDGDWMLGPSDMDYSTLGFTEDEYKSICDANPDTDGRYLLMDKLYDLLGTPNYIGWFCSDDNNTRTGAIYDAEEYVNRMEDPENYGIGSVTAYSTYIGWQFEDYGIVIIVSETSDSGAGSLRVNIQDVTISYVPITYGTLEAVFGSNAVSDFIAAK